nr:hypothetical protein [Tanacetum cinerariifolium]
MVFRFAGINTTMSGFEWDQTKYVLRIARGNSDKWIDATPLPPPLPLPPSTPSPQTHHLHHHLAAYTTTHRHCHPSTPRPHTSPTPPSSYRKKGGSKVGCRTAAKGCRTAARGVCSGFINEGCLAAEQ